MIDRLIRHVPFGDQIMEIEQWRGKYLRVTTEQRGAHTIERAYGRAGVSVILITNEGKVRFIRERDWDTQIVRTKLVSGYLEDGEDPLVGARRELSEETGLTALQWRLFISSTSEATNTKRVQYYFVASSLLQGQAHPDEGEQIEGYVDLAPDEVRVKALDLEFGATETAFALLKLVS